MTTAETTALAAYDDGFPSTLPDSNKHKHNVEQHRRGAHYAHAPKCPVCQRDYRQALGCMNQAEAREWLKVTEDRARMADFLGLTDVRGARDNAADVKRIRLAVARGDQLIPVTQGKPSNYADLNA